MCAVFVQMSKWKIAAANLIVFVDYFIAEYKHIHHNTIKANLSGETVDAAKKRIPRK